MKIGLVTDSASDIPFDWAEKHNIKVTPINVSFNGEDYLEDEKFDLDEYYQNFETQELFKVTTAQPSPAAFLDKYEELISEGYTHIICATISSGLSGTYNSAVLASQMAEAEHDVRVYVVDSKSASTSVVYLLKLALKLIEQDARPEEIVKAMRDRVNKIETTLVLPTLKYLKAGGRVSAPKFWIGTLLGLKPITQINRETGENEAIGTAGLFGNMQKGIEKVYQITTNDGKRLARTYTITHTNDKELAKNLENIIRQKQPDVEVNIVRARSSISAHAGPGALALIALFDKKLEN